MLVLLDEAERANARRREPAAVFVAPSSLSMLEFRSWEVELGKNREVFMESIDPTPGRVWS